VKFSRLYAKFQQSPEERKVREKEDIQTEPLPGIGRSYETLQMLPGSVNRIRRSTPKDRHEDKTETGTAPDAFSRGFF